MEMLDAPELRNTQRVQTAWSLTQKTADCLHLDWPEAFPQPTPASPPIPNESGLEQSYSLAQSILQDWQLKPELPSYQVEFKQALDRIARQLREQSAPGLHVLAGQVDQFSLFVESLQPGQFIDPFFIVARRCLGDAHDFSRSSEISKGLTWNRKWSFYFSSLRVALAAEARRGGGSGPLESDSLDPEMLEVFAQEATTQFEEIENALLLWEKNQDIPTQLKTIRRCFHTLKGAANSVDLRSLGQGFHLLEDSVETLNPDQIPEPLFQCLLTCVDQAKAYITELNSNPHAIWPHDWKASLLALKSTPIPTTDQTPVDLEMLETFVEEAAQLFEQMESAILSWEKLDRVDEQKAALRRTFHTLKGAANSIDLQGLGQGFHVLEDFMDQIQPKDPPIGLFEFLLKCADQVRAYIDDLSRNHAAPWTHDWKQQIDDLKKGRILGASLAPVPTPQNPDAKTDSSEERQVVRVEARQLRQVMHQVTEMLAEQSSFEGKLSLLEDLLKQWQSGSARLRDQLQEPDALNSPLLNPLSAHMQDESSLQQKLNQLLTQYREDNLLLRRHSRRLQNDLASLNMAPVSALFRRLQRVFRDALKEEKKEANLLLEGEHTLLDKTVVDSLYGPLLHVVRNAVAHGIEAPDKREQLGKPRCGKVRMSARPLSDQVVIEVQDDGGGIHEAMVRKRAIDRGMIPADAPDLNAVQIVELLSDPASAPKKPSAAWPGAGWDWMWSRVRLKP
ncbi:MAG: hypothetical protein HC904_08100 [Blastochloris sp.]|nr:hypothetical protein [Blastochloris sp.]